VPLQARSNYPDQVENLERVYRRLRYGSIAKKRLIYCCVRASAFQGGVASMSKGSIMLAKRNVRNLLIVLDEFRNRYQIDCDEFIIYASIGEANVASSKDDLIIMKPTNIANISYGLGIPKETVRRKVIDLIKRGLVKRNNNGVYIADLSTWCQIGAQLGEFSADLGIAPAMDGARRDASPVIGA
jgi:hypothetical protein